MTSARLFSNLKKFVVDTAGVSVVEFALIMPILILVGGGGLELANLVLANQKVERIASVSADSIARNSLAPSERSFVDTFAALDDLGAPFNVSGQGRVILTGIIGVPSGSAVVGKVVWQRCSGSLSGVTSSVGTQSANPANWADGPDAALPNNITIYQNQLVVVAEVAYRYEPLISLAQLPAAGNNGIIRQRSVFQSRGQAFPYVTPSNGITPANCT